MHGSDAVFGRSLNRRMVVKFWSRYDSSPLNHTANATHLVTKVLRAAQFTRLCNRTRRRASGKNDHSGCCLLYTVFRIFNFLISSCRTHHVIFFSSAEELFDARIYCNAQLVRPRRRQTLVASVFEIDSNQFSESSRLPIVIRWRVSALYVLHWNIIWTRATGANTEFLVPL